MKKKTVFLGALAVVAGLSLASCGAQPIVPGTTGNTGTSTPSAGTTAGDATSETTKPAPSTLPEISADQKSNRVDVYINYKNQSGISYNNTDQFINPIDGKTYKKGDLLPAWVAQQDLLRKQFKDDTYTIADGTTYASGSSDNAVNTYVSNNQFKCETDSNQMIDLYYNTTGNIKNLGTSSKVVNLAPYINLDGDENSPSYMPNFRRWLQNEGKGYRSELEFGNEKAIYYTPYLDGYNQVERQFIIDKEVVAKLLDNPVGAGLGLIQSGKGGNAKTVKYEDGAKLAQPFIDKDHNYATDNYKLSIVKNGAVAEITVKQTENIIKQQNALLEKGCTGKELLDQFKTYLNTAYGVGEGNNYANYTDIFASVSACYNADDTIALMRVVKACPDILYGSATEWNEVETLFPRGENDSRVYNMIHFAATVYGVQGFGSEKDHLFYGADGKLYDAETFKASFDLLDKMSAMYNEGLILDSYWNQNGTKADGNLYKNKYYSKTAEGASYGLFMYDYTATQSSANTLVDGIGTANEKRNGVFKGNAVTGVTPVLAPVTYWATTGSPNATATLGSAKDRANKTLTRYYEENRAVKTNSWCIPTSTDNLEGALALMDAMFSEEGSNIQNYGPADYWDMGEINGKQVPMIKKSIFTNFSSGRITDIWDYFRRNIGTTHGIGHWRPSELDLQCTNYYSQEGYKNLLLACNLGVQQASTCKDERTWNATVPTNKYPSLDSSITDKYSPLTTFWAAAGVLSTEINRWSIVVANKQGTAFDGAVLKDTKNYTLTEIKSFMDTKNTYYLYEYAKAISVDCIPDYIKK